MKKKIKELKLDYIILNNYNLKDQKYKMKMKIMKLNV